MGLVSHLETVIPVMATTSAEVPANEDIFNGDPAGDVIRLSRNHSIMFIIIKGAGATGTATLTIESCDDFTPTTSTAVVFHYRIMTTNGTWGDVTRATTSGFLTTAGANQMYALNVRGADLVDGDIAVRIKAVESVDSPCDGAILAVLLDGRYESGTPLAFIS